MMESYLNKEITLEVNSWWWPIGWRTPANAIGCLCPEKGQEPVNFVIDVISDEKGQVVSAIRYSWDEWVKLPLEPRHLPILTRSGAIRCPTVIVSTQYEQNPFKDVSFSKGAIRKRDGGICQVSGRKLAPGEGNMGHDKAASLGGKWDFGNIVLMDKRLNLLQGTRSFAEMGWNLIRKPDKPKPAPVSFEINEPKIPVHQPFIPYAK